jgi:serine/threonine protein kinase
MLLVGPKLDDWKGKRPDVFSYFVKIADFGVARELAAGDASSTIAGTPGYMAPEVHKAHCARGAAGGAAAGTHRLQYDKSVDVYSSGIVVALMR